MLFVFMVILLGAGIYFQEIVCPRAGRHEVAQQPGAPRRIGQSLTRSVVGMCAKVSILDRVMQDRRKDFNRVVFDPIEHGGASTNRESDASRRRHALGFTNHSQIQGVGEVVVILKDSEEQARRQKFMVRLESGKMLLVEHNVEVAQRVDALELGDEVAFCGEYTYDLDGDVIRWTHKDPSAHHAPGWIRHNGRTYQ